MLDNLFEFYQSHLTRLNLFCSKYFLSDFMKLIILDILIFLISLYISGFNLILLKWLLIS